MALTIIGVTGGCAGEEKKPQPEIDIISFMPRVIAVIRSEGSVRVDVSIEDPDPSTAGGDLVFRDHGETDLRSVALSTASDSPWVNPLSIPSRDWTQPDRATRELTASPMLAACVHASSS